MAFNLRLVFSGPCVYVPSQDDSELRVLMVDARQPTPGRQQQPHVPVLLFDLDDLRSAGGFNVVPFLENDQRRGAVFFRRQQILLQGTAAAGAAAGLSFDTTTPLGDDPRAGRFSFEHIPSLDDLVAGAGDVDPAALLDVVPPSTVAARALIDRGEVFTATMSSENAGQLFLLWEVGTNPPAALGLDVGVQADFEGAACLLFESFETGLRSVLEFAPANGGSVRLEISNREPQRVFDGGFRRDQDVLDDPDFAFCYRVAANPQIAVADGPVPEVAGQGAELSGTTCGGTKGNKNP